MPTRHETCTGRFAACTIIPINMGFQSHEISIKLTQTSSSLAGTRAMFSSKFFSKILWRFASYITNRSLVLTLLYRVSLGS